MPLSPVDPAVGHYGPAMPNLDDVYFAGCFGASAGLT